MTTLSIIVPCYNEESRIQQLLEAIHAQTYPLSEMEVVIADGISQDLTRKVINDYQAYHPDLAVRIIDNPRRAIPSGLNAAIQAARGKFIIRMDAHSIPDPDYVENTVRDLNQGLGDNVGGIWKIKPGDSTWIAKAIALSASHPLGAGDALYRIGGVAQEVDTVPFGAFRRELPDKIGLFDETLLSNEDYEFNVRVRKAGGKVWMDPSIRSIYFARATIKDLSKQYWRYGYWKARMLLRYPDTLRLRQLLPPLFVLSLLVLGLLAMLWNIARWMLFIIVLLYASVIILAGIQMSIKHRDISLSVGIPLALVTIHLSWGFALLWSLVSTRR